MEKGEVKSDLMRRWMILSGIVFFLLTGAYLTLSFYAVSLIQPQLQKALGPEAAVDRIRVKATSLSAYGIRFYKNNEILLKVEEIRIYPSLLTPFQEGVYLREVSLIAPSLFLRRTRNGQWVGPWKAGGKGATDREDSHPPKEKESQSNIVRPVRIGQVRIEKGTIEVEDQKIEPAPYNILFRDVEGIIGKMGYPLSSVRPPIELKGKGKGGGREGEFSLNGWIGPETSEVALSLLLRGVEPKLFEPFYRKWVALEIDAGSLNAEIHIAVEKGILELSGRLELIGLQVKSEEGTCFYVPTRVLQNRLKEKGESLMVPIHMKADLSDPRFDLQEALLRGIGFSFAEALGFPVRRMDGVDRKKIH